VEEIKRLISIADGLDALPTAIFFALSPSDAAVMTWLTASQFGASGRHLRNSDGTLRRLTAVRLADLGSPSSICVGHRLRRIDTIATLPVG